MGHDASQLVNDWLELKVAVAAHGNHQPDEPDRDAENHLGVTDEVIARLNTLNQPVSVVGHTGVGDNGRAHRVRGQR